MTRIQNVKKNLIFNCIKYCAQIVLQFVLRTILIYELGVEYLGLNGLFTNIFGFLNLAELGIGSSIVFSMYKPIAENDIEKVKTLDHLYKKLYIIISVIVGLIGLSLTPFIKYMMSGGVSVNINVYILYLMYLAYTLIGYWSAHKRSLLFAYQRNDIENKIKTICLFGMSIIQIIVLITFKNYYIYFSVSIIFTLIECIWIQLSAKRLFPQIRGECKPLDKETKKEISKNVTALSLYKIGGAVVFSTDNILISSFLGLVTLGVYSNYSLITSALVSVFSLLSTSIMASVGNLIASANKDYVYEKFKLTNFMYSYLAAFTTICLITLFQPFILKWTKNAEYLMDLSTVIIISISFYITRMRNNVGVYKEAAGLFWQNRWTPVVEAVVNLVVSIALVFPLGINGIFIGTIVSTVVMPMWVEPLVLYKHYFKKSVGEYFKRYFIDALIMVCGCIICYGVCSFIPDGGWLLLIAKFAVCIVLSNVILILAYLPTAEFKSCWAIVKKLWGNIKAKFNKKKVVDNVENNDIEK